MDPFLPIAERALNRISQLNRTSHLLLEFLNVKHDMFLLITSLNQEYFRYDHLDKDTYTCTIPQGDLNYILSLYAKVAQYHCFTLKHWVEVAKRPLKFETFRMFRRKVLKLCYHYLQISQQDGSLDISSSTLEQILTEFKTIM